MYACYYVGLSFLLRFFISRSDNKEEPTVNVHVTGSSQYRRLGEFSLDLVHLNLVDSGSVTVSEDTTTILLEKDCIVSCPDSLMWSVTSN